MTALRAVPSANPPPPAAEPFATRALARFNGGMHLGDREFLAPALEILETPPSPVHVAFLWIICAFVASALAWAYFGRVDIIAAAQGKFQPTGQVKVVEPVETGNGRGHSRRQRRGRARGRGSGRARSLGRPGRRQ